MTCDQIPQRFSVHRPVTQSGQLDSVCMYFKATFDDDIWFSTAPGAPKTHRAMQLYRTPARTYRAGEMFEMQATMPKLYDHHEWIWHIGRQTNSNGPKLV